jgi:cytochrome c peroxidase
MLKRIIYTLLIVGTASVLLAVVGVTTQTSTAILTPIEQLGKSIFFDENLSINRNQSCAACHAPEVGWTGPIEVINEYGAVYEGSIPGRFGNRKPPSSGYATLSPIFYMDKKGLFLGGNFWDGRATGEKLGNPAADQAQGPFLNPKEQGLPDSACVVYRVCTGDYSGDFGNVWGADACDIVWPADVEYICATEGATVSLSVDDRAKSEMAYDNIALSIAAYEASYEVNAFTSKFDFSLRGMAKLDKQERLGFSLFQGKANCKACHSISGKHALFTDFSYDNLGIPKNPENPVYVDEPGFVDPGLGGFLSTRQDYASFAEANYGKFKVSTLRNVDLRPSSDFVKAFGHNGYFKSLEGIVHFYNTRDVLDPCPGEYTEAEALAANCWPAPEVSETVNTTELGNLGLSPDQEAAIVAFLKTLSDGYTPNK